MQGTASISLRDLQELLREKPLQLTFLRTRVILNGRTLREVSYSAMPGMFVNLDLSWVLLELAEYVKLGHKPQDLRLEIQPQY